MADIPDDDPGDVPQEKDVDGNDSADNAPGENDPDSNGDGDQPPSTEISKEELEFVDEVLSQCIAMADYALSSGGSLKSEAKIDPDLMVTLQQAIRDHGAGKPIDLGELIKVHSALADVIRPAIPRGVAYLARFAKVRVNSLPDIRMIPLAKYMLIVSIASLAVLIYVSSLDCLNITVLGQAFYDRDFPSNLVVAVLLLSAAAIGASFASLFKIYGYIVSGTFDPKYKTTYWIRFILGLLAGYMLAELLPVETAGKLGKIVLAIIGGFSTEVVHWTLERFVETLKTLISGDMSATLAAREAEIKSQAKVKAVQRSAELSKQIIETRANMATAGAPGGAIEALDKLLEQVSKDAIS